MKSRDQKTAEQLAEINRRLAALRCPHCGESEFSVEGRQPTVYVECLGCTDSGPARHTAMEAIAAYARRAPGSGLISVQEYLPDDETTVLAYSMEEDTHYIAHMDEGEWYGEGEDGIAPPLIDISHWMHLPGGER